MSGWTDSAVGRLIKVKWESGWYVGQPENLVARIWEKLETVDSAGGDDKYEAWSWDWS